MSVVFGMASVCTPVARVWVYSRRLAVPGFAALAIAAGLFGGESLRRLRRFAIAARRVSIVTPYEGFCAPLAEAPKIDRTGTEPRSPVRPADAL